MILILLYYLSQNPDFPESVKPLMGSLKNSESMLKFLNQLSEFSEMFSFFKNKNPGAPPPPPPGSPPGCRQGNPPPPPPPPDGCGAPACGNPPPDRGAGEPNPAGQKENPPTPTGGIADKFIEECLERYFKKK